MRETEKHRDRHKLIKRDWDGDVSGWRYLSILCFALTKPARKPCARPFKIIRSDMFFTCNTAVWKVLHELYKAVDFFVFFSKQFSWLYEMLLRSRFLLHEWKYGGKNNKSCRYSSSSLPKKNHEGIRYAMVNRFSSQYQQKINIDIIPYLTRYSPPFYSHFIIQTS